jgi:Protein tyrosine and serine/threonine kinase
VFRGAARTGGSPTQGSVCPPTATLRARAMRNAVCINALSVSVQVYKALRRGVKVVAVKYIEHSGQPDMDGFLKEVAIMKSCRDPHIVMFLGACTTVGVGVSVSVPPDSPSRVFAGGEGLPCLVRALGLRSVGLNCGPWAWLCWRAFAGLACLATEGPLACPLE